MTWVKICGTTTLEDARIAVDAGADALGFIFAPSPRTITEDAAAKICAQLPSHVEKVGVFPDDEPERIRRTAERVGLTTVQLHGERNVQLGQALALGNSRSFEIMFAFSMQTVRRTLDDDLLTTLAPGSPENRVLFDSGTREKPGGTGKTFDWAAAKDFVDLLRPALRVIVAGGLDSDNVADAVRILHPWGVDVVSGVEREPGKKDPRKVRKFVAAVRQATAGASRNNR